MRTVQKNSRRSGILEPDRGFYRSEVECEIQPRSLPRLPTSPVPRVVPITSAITKHPLHSEIIRFRWRFEALSGKSFFAAGVSNNFREGVGIFQGQAVREGSCARTRPQTECGVQGGLRQE